VVKVVAIQVLSIPHQLVALAVALHMLLVVQAQRVQPIKVLLVVMVMEAQILAAAVALVQ
jgi:hypothetical protein